ncbi:MAG: glutathione synthase/RimK-type ligase-like ATP-grasp enzyme [Oleispira sp.]
MGCLKGKEVYKTLIVVDTEDSPLKDQFSDVISFEKYLRDYPKENELQTRLINLCDTEHYLSKGYYCSLLAEARKHVVLPSVKTINSLRNEPDLQSLIPLITGLPKAVEDTEQSFWIYFGKTTVQGLKAFAKKLFQANPSPIIKLNISRSNDRLTVNLQRCAPSMLPDEEQATFLEHLTDFTQTVWRMGGRAKSHRWDMAILVNPEEKVPPSNKEALSRFVKAASKQGIHAEVVSYAQITDINKYDALFIRETTAIDHHTYRLACEAENNNIVVLDDPTSILRCCNKVFLHDAFSYQKVPSLNTIVVSDASDETAEKLSSEMGFPLVLKMPEGSFSNGVYKVKDKSELTEKLLELLTHSALILAQEYCFTDYDWRIGVLNGRAIYACRYKMARNHWQIYNHDSERFFSGGFETMPTFEVPQKVLKAALKACAAVGNGLYGVDIKQKDNHVYVLEVNDNPSIDHKVEDAYLGNELYMQIMSEFQRRLEERGKA